MPLPTWRAMSISASRSDAWIARMTSMFFLLYPDADDALARLHHQRAPRLLGQADGLAVLDRRARYGDRPKAALVAGDRVGHQRVVGAGAGGALHFAHARAR